MGNKSSSTNRIPLMPIISGDIEPPEVESVPDAERLSGQARNVEELLFGASAAGFMTFIYLFGVVGSIGLFGPSDDQNLR